MPQIFSSPSTAHQPRLLDQVGAAIPAKHYSRSTEKTSTPASGRSSQRAGVTRAQQGQADKDLLARSELRSDGASQPSRPKVRGKNAIRMMIEEDLTRLDGFEVVEYITDLEEIAIRDDLEQISLLPLKGKQAEAVSHRNLS